TLSLLGFLQITYFVSLAGDSNGQTIERIREEVFAPAGRNITLSCTYSSAASLQWYLQDPGSAPQYILLILHGVGSPSQAPGLDPRLSVKLNDENNRSDLDISTDSALYYCALRSTVTGNPETLYKNLTSSERAFLLWS
uniref:Ig-like domain-containing protein n=1 Tax=Oncorhynchus mykiss TaxID=8022 RepID=A0A8L0DQN0_ONCMY